MKFTITKSELGFLSDLLGGAQTPGALLAIGNFIGHDSVSPVILGYQNDLNDLVKSQTLAIEKLAKEYFQQDAEGKPLVNPDTHRWVLIDGKTEEDEKIFSDLYKEKTDESMKVRSDLGMTEVSIDIPENVFYNFKSAIMNDVRISDCIRALGFQKEQDVQNFTGVLYNVLAKIDTIQA